MDDLGQRLKQEREARGVSLKEIAEKTRIGVRFLKAIEEETFDQLPGGIFNKSFIQQYAQYLGLDEKQAVRDYLRATSAARENQFPQATQEPSNFGPHGLIRIAMAAAAVVLIALIVWLIVPNSGTRSNSQTEAQDSPAILALETNPSVSDADPIELQEPPDSPTPGMGKTEYSDTLRSGTVSRAADPLQRRETTAAPSPVELLAEADDHEPLAGELPQELLLQINAHSTVWISITADGQREWQGTLQANQSRQVQAAETIRLTVGNAGGVELTLNGKALGALGSEGEVKTVTLAARALQEVIP
jgi:cytoskeleton protein RodZ